MEDVLVNSTALHLAVHFGLENVAKVLLPGAAAALRFASGPACRRLTPLQAACYLGRSTLADLLLQHGADVSAVDQLGRSALHVACIRGHEACTRLLLLHGTETSAVDNYEVSALRYACSGGHEACTRLLLQHGAETGTVDHSGATALHDACQ